MKLLINDIEIFKVFLTSICKFVPSAEFNVNKKFTNVLAQNEGKIIRGFFYTNSFNSIDDDSVKFSFSDLSKFSKSFQLISQNINDQKELELNFDGTFLSLSNKMSFKLRTVKNDVIEKYITNPIKTDLQEKYSIKTSINKVRKVIQASNIIFNEDNKVYFSNKGGSLVAEVDNKLSQFNDSIGIPLSKDINGNVEKVVAVRIQDFSIFSILNTENIKITFTDKSVFLVESELINENKNWIKVKLYIPILKG